MKASIILMLLLLINTLALFAEIISKLIKDLDLLSLIAIEVLLIIFYYKKRVMKGVRKVSKLNMDILNFLVRNGKRSA